MNLMILFTSRQQEPLISEIQSKYRIPKFQYPYPIIMKKRDM